MVAEQTDARRLVFVDEMGSNIALASLYAWAPKGERALCSIPRNRGKNITLLSSIGLKGMGPSLAVEGSTNKVLFETYVERMLCPHLKDGQVVVMDNLSSHKGDRVRELIEGRGCELVYLPAYSPDFNPLEVCQPQYAFRHKLFYHRRRRAARADGVGREARSRPYIRRRGASAMSRGAVPPRP